MIPHGGEDRLPLLRHTLQNLRELPEVRELVVVEMGKHATVESEMLTGEQFEFVDDTGPFHKSRAMNAGLRRAEGALVLWLDNDLIVPKQFICEANGEKSRRKLNGLIAYSNTYFLPEDDSQAVMKGEMEAKNATPVSCNSTQKGCPGGALLVDREWALSCGGMREEFIGWGGEDDAWYYFARHFGRVGVTGRSDQNLYHLFHHNSGGYGSGEQIANNTHYDRNLSLLRKLMRMRRRFEVVKAFPVALP